MVAGDPVIGLSNAFVVTEVRETLPLSAISDPLREDSGKKERVVADVGANVEAGSVIRRLERGQHFEKVVQWILLARHAAASSFEVGVFRQEFGGVVRHFSIVNSSALEHVADDDEEIQAVGNA